MPCRFHRPGRRSGFTVVELLVVILVIATLMGLLIPAVSIAKSKGLKAKAQKQLMEVEAALSQFRTVNGMYPEAGMVANGRANAGRLLTALQSIDRSTFHDQVTEIKDPYKYALLYRPATVYEFTSGVTDRLRIDGENPPRPDSYQLWSSGPNGVDNTHGQTVYGDDLVTWK